MTTAAHAFATGATLAHEGTAPQAVEQFYHAPAFWVALAFVVFWVVFIRYAWPTVRSGLDARAAKIKDQLEQAAKLKTEAEALLKEYEKQKRAATKEAKDIVEQAKRDADVIRARGKEELKASLTRRSQQAEEKIARAEADATAKVRAQIIDIATAATRNVVAAELKTRKDDPAITRVLNSIEQQLG